MDEYETRVQEQYEWLRTTYGGLIDVLCRLYQEGKLAEEEATNLKNSLLED